MTAKTKTVKKAAKSAAKKSTVKRTVLTPDTKIVVLKKENPFREGTAVYKRVTAVLTHSGKTVAELKKHGARTSTVRYLLNHKLARVAA